jgi:RNA polymerase sigma-70 factor (ECF subfamily)
MPMSARDLLAALPRLRRYARLLTGDRRRADDLVEKTLARARQRLDPPPFELRPIAQLLALLRTLYAEEFGGEQASESGPAPHADEPAPGPGPSANPNEFGLPSQADRTEWALAQLFHLPVEQREVIVLVAVEQMSYQEIAALLNVPIATVMTRLAQAREELRSWGVGSDPHAEECGLITQDASA